MLGNINKIKQYMIKVKNISPLRIGNGEEEGNGLLLYDNHAIINGTTLSGLFREFLKEIKISEESEEYKLVFPKCNNKDDKKEISKIYFYDSMSNEKIEKKDLCCRDHIRIDEELGSSMKNHLFNEYHIIEGKTFKLFFEVRGLELEEEIYNCLCDYLEQFISKITIGEISIGSKSSFGFGRFKSIGYEDNVENNIYYFKEYDLSKEDDLDGYLNFNINSFKVKHFKNSRVQDNNYQKSRIKVKLKAYCDEGFIVKAEPGIDEENKVFDKSYKEDINGEDKSMIPSSTIKGVIKNYCNKIYETLDKVDKKDIEDMFGTKSDKTNDIYGKRGKLIFEDCKIDKDKTQIYNRIKIDRFTGGATTGSIFKEHVVIVTKNNPIEFNVILDTEDKKALALIILAFRDIGLGYITIGSGNNVGYGRFKGKSITIEGAEYNKKLEFKDSKLIGDIDEIDSIINILKNRR